jgi:septum formation protein
VLNQCANRGKAKLAGDYERSLILASGSPRRKDLLRSAGYSFRVVPPPADEPPQPGESPEACVERLAHAKAAAVVGRGPPRHCVLAADTLVVLDREPLGKPREAEEAVRMLLRLAGRTHRVLTGFALLLTDPGTREQPIVGVEESRVSVRPISDEEARRYVETGEPLDKAGAYALQGRAGAFVERLEGSRSNVIGLPLERIAPLLAQLGVRRT